MGFDGVERQSLFTKVWQNTGWGGKGYHLLLEIVKKQIYPQVMEKGQEQNIDFTGGGENHPLKHIYTV